MTEHETVETKMEEKYQTELRGGVWILFLLAIFTIGEFVAAVVSPTLGWLLIIVALPKAYFVVTEYMHIGKLLKLDVEEH